jgi:enoyl-[acyl-carrier-protein] reductase (NADH)
VSSAAGRSWEKQLPLLQEFLATTDFDAGERWIAGHDDTDTYRFSKQAMNCYVAMTTRRFLPNGVRINAISPGPTDTPLARANAEVWLGYASDYREAVGAAVLTAEQMAYPMAFLNSPAASGISGTNLFVDHGYAMALSTGAWQPA